MVPEGQEFTMERKHSSKKQTWRQKPKSSHPQLQERSRKKNMELESGFKLSNLTTSHILPLAKLHHLNLHKQSHQLGTKYSNLWAWEAFLIQMTTVCIVFQVEFSLPVSQHPQWISVFCFFFFFLVGELVSRPILKKLEKNYFFHFQLWKFPDNSIFYFIFHWCRLFPKKRLPQERIA